MWAAPQLLRSQAIRTVFTIYLPSSLLRAASLKLNALPRRASASTVSSVSFYQVKSVHLTRTNFRSYQVNCLFYQEKSVHVTRLLQRSYQFIFSFTRLRWCVLPSNNRHSTPSPNHP